jgi:hypothetical protein
MLARETLAPVQHTTSLPTKNFLYYAVPTCRQHRRKPQTIMAISVNLLPSLNNVVCGECSGQSITKGLDIDKHPWPAACHERQQPSKSTITHLVHREEREIDDLKKYDATRGEDRAWFEHRGL